MNEAYKEWADKCYDNWEKAIDETPIHTSNHWEKAKLKLIVALALACTSMICTAIDAAKYKGSFIFEPYR